ncbi:MAG: AI-2E family transporter [Nitrospirota bacterium]
MKANSFYTATSLFLIILLGYLTYNILRPFLTPIAWAVVFAVVFYPVYLYLLKAVRYRGIASFITVVMVILIILGPVTYLSFILVDEVGNALQNLDVESFESLKGMLSDSRIAHTLERIQTEFGVERMDIGETLTQNMKKIGSLIAENLSSWVKNLAGMFIDLVLMVFALFFLLKDGPDFLMNARDYLPFSEDDKNRLIGKVKDMVISTVFGGVVVALIQGLIGGLAFYFLGIESPVLWGVSISLMSFLPLIGTFGIWGPITGYLFVQGSYAKGMILLLIGVFGISMVDNILKPLIISGRTKMPTLAVFFSVLGGIKLFGFIGFIMGPLVLALFVSVFEIFKHGEGGEHA